MAMFAIGIVSAQENTTGIPTQINQADLFSWMTTNPPNYGLGIAFFILGFIGALVAIFGLIGGVIPGTNGKAQLDVQMARLENEEKRLEQLINDANTNPELLKAVEIAVNNIRDDITHERRKQFNQAAIIYLILGAFFAAMLATNMLQAIVIGFGWTAIVGVLGLKNDHEYRSNKKDEVIEKLEQKNEQLTALQENLSKQIDELSEKITEHKPEKGSIRTDADIEHNINLTKIAGRLRGDINSMNVGFKNDNLTKEAALVRKL